MNTTRLHRIFSILRPLKTTVFIASTTLFRAVRPSIHLLAAVLTLVLMAERSLAINASPTPVQLKQPDGSSITLRVRGDEYCHWFEDLNGYTVVLNKGAYVYAVRDAQGGLAPTALAVGVADPAGSGVAIKSGPTSAYQQQRRANVWGAADAALPPQPIAPVGAVKNLVILCRFSDHTLGVHTRAPADYTTLMNTVGGDPVLAPSGSLADYYKTNSYGTMTLASTVIAWVTLPHTEAYYGNGADGLGNTYPQNGQGMTFDAINAANAVVNFGQFDLDNDGFVDAIDIIHSGYAAETGGGGGNWMWSHKWSLPSAWSSCDTNALGVSVKVSAYHTEAALWSTSGTNILRVGVIAHETGHFFGLPDLYDTDNTSEGIGSYCLMANSWGFDGTQYHPPQFSAWCRQQLGFTVPTVITGGVYNIGRAETVSQSYRINIGYPSGEYLLVENRQPWGFETDMPQGGLCIWHIDEAKAGNTSEGYPGQAGWPANNNHYKIALLQADGLYEMEKNLNRGNGADVFRGGGVSSLGSATNTWPNTASYKGGVIVNVSNAFSAISVSGSNMSFTLSTGTPPPPPPTIPVAVDATNLTWTTGGNTPWEGQTAVTHDGVDAAQSGAIPDFGTSYVQTSVTGPSTLSFWWKVSSESGYDFLRVAMDGNNSNSISGEVNWQLINLAIPAGAHTVRWTYSKDINTVGGLDAGFLDQVTTVGGNVAPVLAAIEAGALAYTENQAATAITATITASDVDNANLASGSVSITANFASGQDVLAMSPNPQNGITATYNSGTGVLSLSGSSTKANYQAALRSVTYFNSSDNPSTATRTATFLVNDGAANSNPQARNITVAGVNDAPVLASIEAGALAYTENQAATLITATITASDLDSANLASGSVSITANFASGQDVLAMSPNPQNGITASYNSGSGVLSLAGSSTVANYQAALRSVTYVNTSDSPSTATRTVSFQVNDGAANSGTQTRNITVAGVNDAPVLASIEAGALAYTENQAATLITATITATDADSANLASGSVSITANFASGQDVLAMSPNPQNGITATYNAGSGVLSLSGSSSVVNYRTALRSVTYANTSDAPSAATRTVSFQVNDGTANSGTQTRNITVAGVNDAPVLANIEAGALGYAANQAATLITAAITASDVDNANFASGSVSITANFASGQDVLAMTPNPQNGITASYNAGSGVLSLSGSSSVANYQAALRSVTYVNSSGSPSTATRTVTFLVNDGAANSNPQARNITVSGTGLIPPVTPTNGGIASILLFVPDDSVPSAFKTALDSAGLTYQYFTDETLFNAALAASNPASTLAIVDSIDSSPNFSPLISFVANGGRAILYYWDLDQSAPLAAAFNASVVQDIFTPVPVNDWGGSFFFSHVASPLALFERGYADDGDKLQPTAGGVAVAGHTTALTNGQAAVVIGNSGRTILNSMALQDATNAPAQAAQFALNEIFYLLAPVHGGGRVAVLGAETQTGFNEDVRQKLLATAAFEAVDIIQANAVTPTLAGLQPYSAVLVYSDIPFNNAAALGNVLASYVDAGGGVVVSTFALFNLGSGFGIEGRLLTDGYLPFLPGATASGAEITLVPDQASHPILASVGSLSGGTASFHNLVTVAPNAALVAHWSNGRPLVVTKVTGLGRVVGLNFFPVSQTMQANLWRTNTAGGLLMANALRWSAIPDCTLKTNYVAAMTFTDATLLDDTVSLAFDGTNFWSANGGDIGGNRLARYTAAGGFLAAFAPGIDFRSLFTDAGGRLYAREYSSANILRQTTPGTFVTHVTLSGGSLDDNAAVVLNGNANEYIAMTNGVVLRWSTNGSFLGTVTLSGFGTAPGENDFPQNVRLAAVGNSWLTYNLNRVLSIWNQSGSRIATTVLQNAGTGFDSAFSFSYCAGKAFVVDAPAALWRGYDICISPERPYLSNPVRLAGGQFRMDLHAASARAYAIERTANFITWVPFTTNLTLAPNTTITDTGAAGTNLFYRVRTP
jgi:M6 family metalloprotease-like protein